MSYFIPLIFFFSFFSSFFTLPTSKDCKLEENECAALWENSRCQGNKIGLSNSLTNFGENFNDKLTSLYVRDGCTVILFEHSSFNGPSYSLKSGFSHLPKWFNDRSSSAKCSCQKDEEISPPLFRTPTIENM